MNHEGHEEHEGFSFVSFVCLVVQSRLTLRKRDRLIRWSPQIRRLEWLVARPIAHRGLHDRSNGIIENSESAFAAAMAHDYAIECDLQLTQDGEAVVFHDETLERLTGDHGWVRDCSAAELKRLELKGSRDRIQTLAEMLEQVGGQVPLVIELKSHWDGDERLAERALTVLERYAGPHALMSFDPDLVEAVRLRSPRSVRGIVADRATDPFYRLLPLPRRLELRHFGHIERTRPHFVSYAWRELPFEPVTAIRMAGRPVICWTVRDEASAGEARRYADQITFENFLA